MIAIDFGEQDKLVLWGKEGLVETPKQKGGSSRGVAGRMAFVLETILQISPVTIESASIGSCGLEAEVTRDIVDRSPYPLYLLSGRAVKNLHGKQAEDQLAASTIHEISITQPDRLKLWKYVPRDEKLHRKHTSVRPYDKRGYKGKQVDEWMSVLPSAEELPEALKALFVKKLIKSQRYEVARTLPFAMAMDEPSVVDRQSFERVIGLGEHGFPSFYRRATVALMQRVAKAQTGKKLNAEITPADRKAAWKEVRRNLRHLYAVMRDHKSSGLVTDTERSEMDTNDSSSSPN